MAARPRAPYPRSARMTEMLTITPLDGEGDFAAYCARPEGTPRAAIIVIQEIFGVNAGVRRKCDRLAEAGYLALAPDLFWRLEPAVELDPDIAPEFERALGLMGKFNQDAGVRDIEATIRTARAALGGNGKVGAVGYCLGGRLAYMTAARTDIAASVGYYAVGIDNLRSEEHTSELQSLMRISYAVFCLKKKNNNKTHEPNILQINTLEQHQ